MEGVEDAAKAENLKILFETAQKAIQAYQEARKGEPSTPEIPPIEKNGALVSNEEEEKSNKEEDTSGKKRQESAGKSQENWKKKKTKIVVIAGEAVTKIGAAEAVIKIAGIAIPDQ
ncbi:uncharacterized protein LOC123275141 [Cotesia glomerata]|uniref:Uncharacterized protein n=1 Tax=Cotesia glomerata TaxID=32391 RepID=A0AAV7J5N4_COTGL|nr:uncharacterized protein LOC123275141 [Cotesia glomerata]KAH0568081.1 hypothetical protein KQX54_018154 [Cotesia glomerata]